ncbi:MAG TPA: class D sortase [Thermoanaerobaculia bacterium]|nr:class D sortase [Thermoanaerobaculia bacterium]
MSAGRLVRCIGAALVLASGSGAVSAQLPGDDPAFHPDGFHCPPEAPPGADFDQAIAWIEFPRFGLLAPVYQGTAESELRRGAGLVDGTALPGVPDRRRNCVIAAHRTSYFSPLESAVAGDVFSLITGAGVDDYVVERVLVVTPDHVELERPTRTPKLTLVTCTPFNYLGPAPDRLVVIASKRGREAKTGRHAKKRTPGRASHRRSNSVQR